MTPASCAAGQWLQFQPKKELPSQEYTLTDTTTFFHVLPITSVQVLSPFNAIYLVK